MALFKILRGGRAKLDEVDLHDGWAYFTTDTHEFFIDYDTGEKNNDGTSKLARASVSGNKIIPRLSPEGVYYLEATTIQPAIEILCLSGGTAEDFEPLITYIGGNASTINYEEILQSI